MSSDPREIPAIVTTDLSTHAGSPDDPNDVADDPRSDAYDATPYSLARTITAESSVPPMTPPPASPTSPSPPNTGGLGLSPHGHHGHNRSPSDPAFLSPSPILKVHSLDVPRPSSAASGYASSNDGTCISIPPSPTLSARSSVHFATTLALRDNKPDEASGLGSLGLLDPSRKPEGHEHAHGHGRKGSTATFASGEGSAEGTEPDHRSYRTSMTATSPMHSPSPSDVKPPRTIAEEAERKDKDGKKVEIEKLDPDNDETPCEPFAFRPYKLASLVDPKNMELLTEMGGIEGLIRGLGTHRTKGLAALALSGGETGGVGAGVDAGQRHERADKGGGERGHAPTAFTSASGGSDEKDVAAGEAYSCTLDDRYRVYGQNILPTRQSKSLLTLMWLALKDKVLVRI